MSTISDAKKYIPFLDPDREEGKMENEEIWDRKKVTHDLTKLVQFQ